MLGFGMSTKPTGQELNRALADQINAEARASPQSPYAGKFVGIANSQPVFVADDPEEMVKRLRRREPEPIPQKFGGRP